MSFLTIGIILFCVIFWQRILGLVLMAGTMLAAGAVGLGFLVASPFVFVANKLQARKTQKALEARREALQARR